MDMERAYDVYELGGSPSTEGDYSVEAFYDTNVNDEYKIRGKTFQVTKRYKPLKAVGNGAYGLVFSALDTWSHQNIAIKQVSKVFDDLVDAKRILREVKLLAHFAAYPHPNLLSLANLLLPPDADFKDLYLVTELMETDLHRVIYSEQPLTLEHVQCFLSQLLAALSHLHAAGIIHRDLKPQNILLDENCNLKLCDFGLARSAKLEASIEMTEYVVTRWYRPPEILLANRNYGTEVDIWGAGCIAYELVCRKPLFPGGNYLDMLRRILKTIAVDINQDLAHVVSRRGKVFVKEHRVYDEPLRHLLKGHKLDKLSRNLVELIEGMLMFNPLKRWTIKQAMRSTFIDEPEFEENECENEIFQENDMDYVESLGENVSEEMLRELFMKEIAKFNIEAVELLYDKSKKGQLLFAFDVQDYEHLFNFNDAGNASTESCPLNHGNPIEKGSKSGVQMEASTWQQQC